MRISDFREERNDARYRATATVTWEDCGRPPQQVFFETDREHAPYLWCNPHAFLVAGVMPAMRYGERRVALDAQACPELVVGLQTAMRWLRRWYGESHQPVVIETLPGIPQLPSDADRRAAMFLSGGLDSLAVLWFNRTTYPLDHPNAYQTGILVHGFDIGAFQGGDQETAKFEQAMRAVKPIAEDVQLPLVPVYTNVRHLADEVDFWMHDFHAAALSSVAHAFSRSLCSVAISSTATIECLHAWGSHPLLDPCYSSADLRPRWRASVAAGQGQAAGPVDVGRGAGGTRLLHQPGRRAQLRSLRKVHPHHARAHGRRQAGPIPRLSNQDDHSRGDQRSADRCSVHRCAMAGSGGATERDGARRPGPGHRGAVGPLPQAPSLGGGARLEGHGEAL